VSISEKHPGEVRLPSAGVTNSYSTVAVIPEFPKSGRVVVAGTGLYTCPAGKKAKVKGSMNLDAVGADATYAIAIKRGATFFPIGVHVAVNGISVIATEITMEAGDILTNIGDAGSTNGTCDMDCSIQEIPV